MHSAEVWRWIKRLGLATSLALGSSLPWFGGAFSSRLQPYLLAAGKKGKRYALPHSRIMLHQPLGGAGGQTADIAIHAKEIVRVKESLSEILMKHTGQKKEIIRKDTDRNFFMDALEAKTYGIIDEILTQREIKKDDHKA